MAFLTLHGHEPLGIPRGVAPAAIVCPPAMIDGKTVIGGIIAVDVEKHFHAIVRGEIGVARPPRGDCSSFRVGDDGTVPFIVLAPGASRHRTAM